MTDYALVLITVGYIQIFHGMLLWVTADIVLAVYFGVWYIIL